MATQSLEIVIAVTVGITQGISFLASPSNSPTSYALYQLAAMAILIQWIAFVHASGILGNKRTEKYYDFTGACTYAILTLYSEYSIGFDKMSTRQVVASICIFVWCIRLGYYLFSRSLREGGIDSRFATIKADLSHFMITWTLQGLWAFVCSLPVFMLNTVVESKSDKIGPLAYAGLGIFAFGLIFETVADDQKRLFRSNNENHNRFITTGLWSLSRHPNYFGEICVWIGIYLLCYGGFITSLQRALGLFSPLFITVLLIYVSGINLLERSGNVKWGENAEYKAYKQQTPVLIPLIGRKGDALF